MVAQELEQPNPHVHRRSKMTDEKEKPKIEKKKAEEPKKGKTEVTPEKKEPPKSGENTQEKVDKKLKEEKKEEAKVEEPKKEEKPKEEKKKKVEEKSIPKKEEAIANGSSLPISKKHSMYLCTFIKNKPIDDALKDLDKVLKYKKAVPYKGEIPHRKGMSTPGRYPIKAAGYFVNLLKGLKGNVIVNGMDLDKTKIYLASASWASRPTRRGGVSAKRTNIILKAKEFVGGKK
jgi:ribosomal protein L22